MVGEFGDGHEFQEDVSEDALPARGDDPLADGRDDPLERVEEVVLSGVDGVDHGRRNSLFRK
jgi:hypothetical protein